MRKFRLLNFILLLAAILLFCSLTQAQTNTGKLVYADDPGRIQIINADGTGQTKLTGVTIGELRLITETGSDRAIALNTASLVAEPFSLTTEPNFGADHRTRISLFVEDLRVFQTFTTIVVDAVDVQQNHVQLPLEAIAFYTIFPFQQLIVRLPENLSTPVLFVTVKVNGSASNTARISIKP